MARGTVAVRAKVARVRSTGTPSDDVSRAIGLVDGLGWLRPDETILVKPNYNTAHPPPGSTAPDFLGAVLGLLRKSGAERVVVGESTSYLNHRKVLEQGGAFAAAAEHGVPVVVFDEEGWETVPVGGRYLKRVKLTRALRAADRIVYVCCPKTHHAAQFTGSLKLGMGFVHNWRRTLWHMRSLQEKIADLNRVLAPDLILADMRRTFIRGGPATGEAREPGLILASRDRVAIDLEAIRVIRSFAGHDLPEASSTIRQIACAVELGIGSEEYELVEG